MSGSGPDRVKTRTTGRQFMNFSRFPAFLAITGSAARKNSLQMRRFQRISEFSHSLGHGLKIPQPRATAALPPPTEEAGRHLHRSQVPEGDICSVETQADRGLNFVSIRGWKGPQGFESARLIQLGSGLTLCPCPLRTSDRRSAACCPTPEFAERSQKFPRRSGRQGSRSRRQRHSLPLRPGRSRYQMR